MHLKKIFISSDHAGFNLKKSIIQKFSKKQKIVDLGPSTDKSVDYPDYARKLSKKISSNNGSFGILICGSGTGMAIAANKIAGIRAGLCHDQLSARQAREHNDTNMLCLGGLIIGVNLAKEIVDTYLKARYQGAMPEGSRYLRRVTKIKGMDQ